MATSLRSAVVLGGTGLVGRHLLRLLATDSQSERLVVLGRRPSGVTAPSIKDLTVDLAAPDTYRDHLQVDCVFCALGTTIKVAGSEAAFRRVDFEYPLTVAQAARAAGAKRYVLVSAVGADPKSLVFYNQVKGELEVALKALAFPGGLAILHPSLLLGERTEPRLGEQLASGVMRATAPLFLGALKKYRAIDAEAVARAMITAAKTDASGPTVYEGETLFRASAVT